MVVEEGRNGIKLDLALLHQAENVTVVSKWYCSVVHNNDNNSKTAVLVFVLYH